MDHNQKENYLRRGIYLLPNMFTVGSLFAGFYGIISAVNGNYDIASIAIFIAMVMDSLDGRVARLTHTVTAFGAEFDSITDMVSFGLAPALIIYKWGLASLGKFGWVAAFVYAAATALRLARFNVQLGSMSKRYFKGLPCPAAAAVIVGLVWVGVDVGYAPQNLSIVFAFVAIAVGVLEVSNIHYRSFKDFNYKKQSPFVIILLSGLVIVLISMEPAAVLLTMFSVFALSGPIGVLWGLRRRNKEAK